MNVSAINMEAAQKVIRQQLVLLLHAHSCQQREAQAEEGTFECNLPYCKSTKEVLNHIRGCTDGSECSEHQCIASQQIISHWKHCSQKKRCEVCGPVFVSQISNALSAMNH